MKFARRRISEQSFRMISHREVSYIAGRDSFTKINRLMTFLYGKIVLAPFGLD